MTLTELKPTLRSILELFSRFLGKFYRNRVFVGSADLGEFLVIYVFSFKGKIGNSRSTAEADMLYVTVVEEV